MTSIYEKQTKLFNYAEKLLQNKQNQHRQLLSTIVKNAYAKIKELISASGLNWDEKCLKYNENKNAIKTLSVNQARKKIYSSEIKSNM